MPENRIINTPDGARRIPTPEEREPNPDSMPGYIPLLSNMGSEEGNGLSADQKGIFSAIRRNDESKALADMEIIVRSMVGEANARNSIPDIRAQNLCFRYMLRNINNGTSNAIANVYGQWRGALCAYILSPLVMAVCPGLCWQHIVARELNQEDDRLGQAIYQSLNISDTHNEQIDWHLLTMQHNETRIPLLDFSKEQLAIPSASLEDSEAADDVFPWIGEDHKFGDPLDMLSLQALEYIDRWMSQFIDIVNAGNSKEEPTGNGKAWSNATGKDRNAGDKKKEITEALQSIEDYRSLLQGRMQTLRTEDPHQDVWITVLQALLMRDLIDSGIYIVSVQDQMGKYRFKRDMQDAPADEAHRHTRIEILERFSYAIFLNKQFLGFLDTTCGIWLYAPGYFGKSAEYRQLLQTVQKQLAQPELRQAYVGQLSLFLNSFTLQGQLRTELRQHLEGVDYNKIYTINPVLKQLHQGEITALKMPFDMFGRIVGFRCDDGHIFTSRLLLFPSADKGIYEYERNNTWGTVLSTEDTYKDKKALLPVTACGVTLIRNSEALHYIPILTLEQEKETGKIGATLRVQRGLVEYVWQSQYNKNNTQFCELLDLPAVCYWPNGTVGDGDAPWKIYYTYVHFHEKEVPVRFTSAVYNANGNKMTKNTLRVIQIESKDGTHYSWQTHASNVPPSCCTLEDNGQCLGSIMFGRPDTFPAFTRDAMLAIDFGTTTTTGAVLLDKDRIDHISTPLFAQSTLKWEMMGDSGPLWSLKQFIADQLNRVGTRNGSGSFYSAFARFTPQEETREELPADKEALPQEVREDDTWLKKPSMPNNRQRQQELFVDGHIYYYADSMYDDNPMGNQRYVGLKLKELDKGHDWSEDNISMFLQQVLEMYLLYCRMNGAKVKQILFAFPLAFKKTEQEMFREKIKALLASLVDKVGLEVVEPDIKTESQAVCAYFASIPIIQAAMLDKGIITLDVGGGTTDYSHCMVNKESGNLCEFYSNYMGGQRMLAEYAYQCNKQALGSKPTALKWFYEGLKQIAEGEIHDAKADIDAFLAELTAQSMNQKENFTFCIDRFVSLRPDLFQAVLQTEEFHEQYMLLLFELTLLLWFGYLIGIRSRTLDNTRDLPIYLAGNGSNLFHLIRKEDLTLIETLICEQGKVRMTVIASNRPKREVAEGLLLSEVNIGDGKSQCELVTPNTPIELWNAFSGLNSRFIESFQSRNGQVMACLKDTFSVRGKDAKEQFLARNHSLQDLCTYLVSFCDILISYLTKIG